MNFQRIKKEPTEIEETIIEQVLTCLPKELVKGVLRIM
jgi:hypothetical protein